MTHGRRPSFSPRGLRTIVALAVLLAVPLALAGETGDNRQGVVYSFAAGDAFSWRLPAQEYHLYVAADEEGAELDVREMGDGYPGPTERIGPNGASGNTVRFAEGQLRTLKVINGTGRLILGQMDMQRNLPLKGPPHSVTAHATILPGECRSYMYGTTGMRDLALLNATGEGLSFTTYEDSLKPRAKGEGSLQDLLDSQVTPHVLPQVCNRDEQPRSFTIQGIYPAPEGSRKTVTKNETPAGSLATLLVGVGFALLASRRTSPPLG